ncbi:MAG TPA: tRNA 2-thiouridine(34) synthase MnmA [Candidatus Kapabacteria bacterium]|nr:tRNA 2-thiouridine(34) synthase MnmA [Candidatus Kapabacteria bacterium]HPO62419.1 tRNA 2-thiouridine(34) synthase MnmA [Candidatus Kapabacteria bacterium]
MKKKCLIGMSGGVDSSVSAALLLEMGYEVEGLTITPFRVDPSCRQLETEKSCCSAKSLQDAHNVCEQLGIKHHLVDLTEAFKEQIVSKFIQDYLSGKTPNPCVLCNPLIKWEGLIKTAEKFGCDYVSTGHYAKINYNKKNKRYYISKGADPTKDQSYFLWKLSQEQLSKTIFPLADYKKTEIKEIAGKLNLYVEKKPESQEICFIPDNNYHNFLENNVTDIRQRIGKGNIFFNDKIIGQHNGYPFYTIGQRKGLGISHTKPLYVKSINAKENILVVAEDDDISSISLIANELNFQKYLEFDEEKIFNVKIRYKDKGSEAKCIMLENGTLHVKLLEKKKAVTPGQSVVIYEDNDLVAGGIIFE